MSKTGERITMTDHYSQMDLITQKTIETARNYSNIPKLIGSAAKLLQSCPTLCDPRDGSPPGSTVPGILQARTLEWVAISFSNALKWKVKVKSLSRVWLSVTPWTAAYQALPSMGFSRQEYWSGLPLPSLVSPYKPYTFHAIVREHGFPYKAATCSFCIMQIQHIVLKAPPKQASLKHKSRAYRLKN